MRRADLARRTLELLGELTRFAAWLAADDGQAVDDVVQEAVARALANAGSVRDSGRLKPWLFRILRNIYLDRRRAHATRHGLVVLRGGLDDLPEVEVSAAELPEFERIDLERALAELPELARSALLLHDLWGFEISEIALILDVPIGTVKSRIARARSRLAARLGERALASRPGRSS